MTWRDVGLWRLLTDWIRDPLRRRRVLWRIAESLIGLAVYGLAAELVGLLLALLIAAEWLVYEFLLEPARLAGPYWERGPGEGETFKYW